LPAQSAFELLQRFLEGISVGDDCWEWLKFKDRNGYGQLQHYLGPPHRTQSWKVHRYAYVLFIGPIPKGMLVCHKCDNPSCVKPSHLFLGTYADNRRDCIKKGRDSKRHESKKIPLDQIRVIKAAYARGESQKSLAQRYKVTRPTIWYNLHNRDV